MLAAPKVKISDSDLPNNTAMDPVRTCDVLLSYLKLSNLNFHLTESPFSASIEIRKTFVKDKNGFYRTRAFSGSDIGVNGKYAPIWLRFVVF